MREANSRVSGSVPGVEKDDLVCGCNWCTMCRKARSSMSSHRYIVTELFKGPAKDLKRRLVLEQ